MSPEQAKEWTHYFIAAVYAFPIVGAILSDWLLGKYRTIVFVSLLYCVGHAVLALMDYPQVTHIDPKWMLAVGLGADRARCWRHQAVRFGPRRRPVWQAEQAPDHQGLRLVLFLDQFGLDVFDAADALAAWSIHFRPGLGVRRARRFHGDGDVRVLAGPPQVRPHSARRATSFFARRSAGMACGQSSI